MKKVDGVTTITEFNEQKIPARLSVTITIKRL